MKNRICKIIDAELQCDTEMRIAVTLFRHGVTAEQWNDLCGNPKTRKAPWTSLPEPSQLQITTNLLSLEKGQPLWARSTTAKAVKAEKIPSLPELEKALLKA